MSESREMIAERILSEMTGQGVRMEGRYALCPGFRLHSTRTGRKDFQVMLDGAPTGYCLHATCMDVVAEFNLQLRRAIYFAEHGRAPAPRGHWGEGVAAEPQAKKPARPPLDRALVEEHVRGVPAIDEEWLRRRSPVDVRGVTPGAFLDALYEPGERVLVFCPTQFSQGDFGWHVGRPGHGWRLPQERNVAPVRSALPRGGKEGVWYLCQPVTGKWQLVTEKVRAVPAEGGGEPEMVTRGKWTRRSHDNVTEFRFFVLESDVLPAAEWLRVVANLAMPIVALYTSGGKSIHALVRMPVPSKAHFDQVRDGVRQMVCPLGADPAALTAVRLSRLPGCYREQREQRLLWLAPKAGYEALRLLPEVRE
jgi:hypothetical protein